MKTTNEDESTALFIKTGGGQQEAETTSAAETGIGDDRPRRFDAEAFHHSWTNWRWWLFVGCTLAATAVYLDYIASFGVNVVYWDEFSWVPIMHASQTGTLSFSALWALHNADRELFPNLVAIALTRLTHWNDFYFFGLSALLLTFSVCVILWICRKDLVRSPLWFVGVPVLAFTLAQYENTLWAYQLAWYIVLAALVTSLATLLEHTSHWLLWLSVATILGAVASYSSLQGLLVWPAGLVVLMAKGRPILARIAWTTVGAIAIAIYFIGFSDSQMAIRPVTAYFHQLPETLKAVFLSIGNVIPNFRIAIALGPLKITSSPSYQTTEWIGAAIFVWSIALLVVWIARGRPDGIAAFSVALIVAGVGFNVLLIPSRFYGDLTAALASRYVTMNVLLYIGVYLGTVTWARSHATHGRRWLILPTCAVVLVVIQAFFSTSYGLANGQQEYALRTTSADIMANSKEAPVALIEPYLDPSFAGVDSDISILKTERMNIFDGNESTRFQDLGIFPCCVSTQLALPAVLSDWLREDHGAQVAWRALSAVAIDFMSSTQQRAFEDGTTSLGESIAIVTEASHMAPVPTSELLPGYPPPSTYFLEANSAYYNAWAKELPWHEWNSIEPTGRLRAFVDAHPLALLAWKNLVGARANIPDLTRHFSIRHPHRLLQWAANASKGPRGLAVLVPLHRQYFEMSRLAT